MAVHKRKKNERQRAKTTHGCGSMKKRRGAGNRGGRGLSGSGKRGDQKKTSLWKDKKYFGKHGFKSKSRTPKIKTVNLKSLEDRAEGLVKRGAAKFENGAYVIDLSAIGYNKLLSTGTVTKKFIITTAYATEKAVEKIKKAGGEVKVTEKRESKQPEAGKKSAPEEAAPAEESSA